MTQPWMLQTLLGQVSHEYHLYTLCIPPTPQKEAETLMLKGDAVHSYLKSMHDVKTHNKVYNKIVFVRQLMYATHCLAQTSSDTLNIKYEDVCLILFPTTQK